ncbi:hypothetical protein, partial [Jeotgalibaca porci]|uniref:hypothetical protein n=1 Tax=Jeotgalibaca porci TaxID=1868793 RepID=UPI0035A0827E
TSSDDFMKRNAKSTNTFWTAIIIIARIRAMIIDLERKVHSLVRELKDLDYIYDSQYQTLTECRPVINDFFSGLFSEWSTKHIIEKNLELLASLQKNVQHILSILLERKHELEHDFLSFSKAE